MAIHYFNTSIRNLAWRLRKFEEVLAKNLAKEMHANEDEIIEMIQHQLYDKGINGAGVEIKSYMPYKPSTIRKKQKKGQPFDRVTLRDTGQWYNSLVLVDDIEGFFITSTVAKNKYIKQKYGPKVVRLTNENLSILLNKIRPVLKVKLEEYIKSGKRTF